MAWGNRNQGLEKNQGVTNVLTAILMGHRPPGGSRTRLMAVAVEGSFVEGSPPCRTWTYGLQLGILLLYPN